MKQDIRSDALIAALHFDIHKQAVQPRGKSPYKIVTCTDTHTYAYRYCPPGAYYRILKVVVGNKEERERNIRH